MNARRDTPGGVSIGSVIACCALVIVLGLVFYPMFARSPG